MGHSKSLKHHVETQSLFCAWYKHATLKRKTPATDAGYAGMAGTIQEVIECSEDC